ncbi:helix-turn-helix domain-containing protein [Desmospora activa]|uniref:Cytoskeletal protein RodZ n=1 Tax=Desmospora activa DSM 45169 TaxID=1121389 RepID=A0A2T4ZAK3_9BACL|nr:helix-turn-helix domain-containing protein [Desmospora activa]PTM58924.1 cytoskeletal protein RodZ [Desmospora activa DSM 45169]
MSGIGSYLKQTRESLGYTLDQVQKSTKIHIEYLRALENDQYDALPSAFYVRAFLRTYAHSLGLDAQPLLDRYERYAASGRPSVRRMSQPSPQKSDNRPTLPPTRNKMSGTHPRIGRTYSPQSQRMAPPVQPTQPSMDEQQQQAQYYTGQTPPVQPTQPSKPPAQEYQSSRATPPSPSTPAVEQMGQATQRMQPAAMQPQPMQPQPTRSASKQESVSQNTFTPRRVSQEVSRGIEQGDGKPKKKKANWFVRVAAVGALILIPLGAYVSGVWPFTSSQAIDSEQPQNQDTANSGSTPTVDAQTPDEIKLQVAESGSDMEGDLYTLEGAEQIEIEIKANKGDSQFRFGNKVNDSDGEAFELQIGDRKKITDDTMVWFRLGSPSNTEIKVNGLEIDTTAQDVPKSYRIQLEK